MQEGGAVWKTSEQCGLGFGGCLSFDGVNNYVSILDSDSLDLTLAATISLWIKLPSIPTDDRRILHKAESYMVRTNPAGESPRISAFIKIGGSWEPRVSLPTSDEETNNWMHLAISYNAAGGTNNFKLYKMVP